MAATLITYEAGGFPVELVGEQDFRRAIAAGRLRADTIVRVHSPNGAVDARHARDVLLLQPLFGIDPSTTPSLAPPAPTPPPPPRPSLSTSPQHGAPGTVALARGQNVAVGEPAAPLERVLVGVSCAPDPTTGLEVDFGAFLLREDGKVAEDADLVFYNNDSDPSGAVRLLAPSGAAAQTGGVFDVELATVGEAVQRICFTASIYAAAARGQSFGHVGTVRAEVSAPSGRTIARFDHDEPAAIEAALIVGELYRRGAGWKFRAVGQGYAGGLDAMAKAFGVDVAD